jgi:hypothetical protein
MPCKKTLLLIDAPEGAQAAGLLAGAAACRAD